MPCIVSTATCGRIAEPAYQMSLIQTTTTTIATTAITTMQLNIKSHYATQEICIKRTCSCVKFHFNKMLKKLLKFKSKLKFKPKIEPV